LALEAQGLALEAQGLVLEAQGLVLEAQGLALEAQGLALEAQGLTWLVVPVSGVLVLAAQGLEQAATSPRLNIEVMASVVRYLTLIKFSIQQDIGVHGRIRS
jgi:hypothetical protein